MNWELPDVQAWFQRGGGNRNKIANICWIMEEAREFQKNIYFCLTEYTKMFANVDHNTLFDSTHFKTLKETEVWDPLSCLLKNRYAGQEATVRPGYGKTDWFQIRKQVRQSCILSLCLFNLYVEYTIRNTWPDESQTGIRLLGEISTTSNMQMIPFNGRKWEELKSLYIRMREKNEHTGLKFNIQKTKIIASGPTTSWQIEG